MQFLKNPKKFSQWDCYRESLVFIPVFYFGGGGLIPPPIVLGVPLLCLELMFCKLGTSSAFTNTIFNLIFLSNSETQFILMFEELRLAWIGFCARLMWRIRSVNDVSYQNNCKHYTYVKFSVKWLFTNGCLSVEKWNCFTNFQFKLLHFFAIILFYIKN